MYVPAKIIKDKKDREIILRNAEEDDAEKLIDYLKITAAETPFLIREPDEITLSIKQEQEFIKTINETIKYSLNKSTIETIKSYRIF